MLPMMFTFYRPGKLQTSFQGYQGAEPTTSRIIFLGKDANFPEISPASHPDTFRRVCRFLAGQEWKAGAVFRASSQYEDRNIHTERAHHPFLLDHFPGGRDGAPYHGKIARLIDKMFSYLAEDGQNDLAANFVGRDISFVELVRFATTGNNGRFLNRLFRGILPPGAQYAPLDFCDRQKLHREETIPNWLLNVERANRHRTVVIPMSIFSCLCQRAVNQAANLCLTPDHRKQAHQWFASGGKGHIYHLPGFDDRDWLITDGFPYFFAWKTAAVERCLGELAKILSQRLLKSE